MVLVLAAVGTAYYFGYDHGWEKSVKNTPTAASPSPSTNETANWKAYTGRETHYSFKYPLDWILIEPKNPDGCTPVVQPPNSKEGSMSVCLLDLNSSTPEQLASQKQNGINSISRSTVVVDDRTSIKLVDKYNNGTETYVYVPDVTSTATFASKNNEPDEIKKVKGTLTITFFVKDNLDIEYKNKMDQILSTFKFTP